MSNPIVNKVIVTALSITTILSGGQLFDQVEAADQHNRSQKQETLSIGSNHLPESRHSTKLTKGVTHTEISRGYYSNQSYFTVDVAFLDSKERARTIAKELEDKGYQAKVHQIKNKYRGTTDVEDKKIGYVVRTGEFDNKVKAEDLSKQVKEDGYEEARVTFSEYDGTTKTTGPWEIDVIEINPNQFEGELTNRLAEDQVPGRETVSSIVDRTKAIAGMNGGYFVFSSEDGVTGDPAGVSIVDGKLVSEAVGERTSLLLSNNRANIAHVATEINVETSTGATSVIDGINREAGVIRSCGGVDDLPTSDPKHDVTCTDEDEMIQYTPLFGESTPEGQGVEVVINESGVVVEAEDRRGHQIPEKGSVLAATGKRADWLKANVDVGDQLTINKKVNADGEPIKTPTSLDVIGGGPQLLNDGEINILSKKEGFRWSEDFYYHFAQYRHPRSFAGIKENGNILLVTVDGRNPHESIGVSFYESAKILQSLGAVEGMNLDGGGSSSMVVNDQLVNHPSDSTGERPVSDGILLLN